MSLSANHANIACVYHSIPTEIQMNESSCHKWILKLCWQNPGAKKKDLIYFCV